MPDSVRTTSIRAVAPVERAQEAGDLAVAGELDIDLGESAKQRGGVGAGAGAPELRGGLGCGARDQRLDRPGIGPRAMGGVRDRGEKVDPLGRARARADDMEPMGDQRVFEFEHGVGEPARLGLDTPLGPRWLGRREIDGGGLRLQHGRDRRALARRFRRGLAIALERRLEIEEAAIEPRVRDRRGHVADERRRRPAFRERAFGRVVRGVEVDVRHVADQPVRPVGLRETRLLAGHEFERPVGAEMQHGIGPEILLEVAIEGREGVGRREALLEQEAHRVALVSERGLDPDEDIAEVAPEHVDRAAIGLLLAGRRPPLGLDLLQPGLAAHVIVRRDLHRDVGVRAMLARVARHDALAQRVDPFGQIDGVALGLERDERVPQALEHREIGGGAGVAGVRREVEQHDREPALRAPRGPERDQPLDPARENIDALGAGRHVAGLGGRGADAPAVAAGTRHAGRAGAATEHHRAGRAVELGDRDHDGLLDRQEPAVGGRPAVEGLELDRVRRDIGHVERAQHHFGRFRVVVGWPADEAEPRERHQRVDGRFPVLQEVALDRGPGVEPARERRHDLEPTRLERVDHPVVMRGVAGERVGAHHEDADPAPRGHGTLGTLRQARGVLGDAWRHARVIDADIRVFDGIGCLERPAIDLARPVGVAIDEARDEGAEVLLRPRQPELQHEEVDPQILRRAGDEAQDARQLAQHRHLARARARRPAARRFRAQFLQERHGAGVGSARHEATHAGQLRDLGRGHGHDHGVAGHAARLERRQDAPDMLVHEHHGDDDDVAPRDVGLGFRERAGILAPGGGGVERERQTRKLATQLPLDTRRGAREVIVERDEHHPDRRRFSGRNGLWHRTTSPR